MPATKDQRVVVMARIAQTFAKRDTEHVVLIRGRETGRIYVLPERLADMVDGDRIGVYSRATSLAQIWDDLDAGA